MKTIEKIRQKIEELYDGEAPKHDQQCDFSDGYFTGLSVISNFLDTLSEEPICLYDGGAPSKQKCGDCTIACSIRVEEKPNKDLNEAADRFANTQNKNFLNPEIVKNIFIAGAKWQEKRDEETIKTAEDHAFLAGAEWQKEQLMKWAVEGVIIGDIGSQEDKPHDIYVESMSLPLDGKWKMGDKVCIIVLPKEDDK